MVMPFRCMKTNYVENCTMGKENKDELSIQRQQPSMQAGHLIKFYRVRLHILPILAIEVGAYIWKITG